MNRTGSMVAFLGAFLILGACERDPSAAGTARVTVLLTDAPGDLASAEVEIREVYLQGRSEEEGGRVVLFSGSRLFDLLQLRDGVMAELAEAVVPAGTYAQLRLILGDATITTEGGVTYSTAAGTLHCPSCATSGLKIRLPGGQLRLDSGEQSLIVDFDVAQSFGRAAGASGRWVMHPVITATRAEATGAIEGTVSLLEGVALPSCGGTEVDLTHFVPTAAAGEVSLSGRTDVEGNLRFAIVAPGTYTMGFADEVEFDNGDVLSFTASSTPSTLQVTSGAVAGVEYQISAAGCAPAGG